MPEPLSLISSTDIKQKEFTTFLEKSGVVLHPDNLYDGRLSKGNIHVWIALDNNELKNFDANEIEVIRQKLGGIPQSHILLDVSKELDSEQMALEFACKFSTQWHCVIYNSSQKFYSANELLELCQNSQTSTAWQN